MFVFFFRRFYSVFFFLCRRRIDARARSGDGRRTVRRDDQHGRGGILRRAVRAIRGPIAAVPQHCVPDVGRGGPARRGGVHGRRRPAVHVGGAAPRAATRAAIGRRTAGEPDVRHGRRDTDPVAERHHREPQPTVGHGRRHQDVVRAQTHLQLV